MIQNLGAADIDTRLEEQLIDGILFAFQEQVKKGKASRGHMLCYAMHALSCIYLSLNHGVYSRAHENTTIIVLSEVLCRGWWSFCCLLVFCYFGKKMLSSIVLACFLCFAPPPPPPSPADFGVGFVVVSRIGPQTESDTFTMLNGFGTVVNALGLRAKAYLPQISGTVKASEACMCFVLPLSILAFQHDDVMFVVWVSGVVVSPCSMYPA